MNDVISTQPCSIPQCRPVPSSLQGSRVHPPLRNAPFQTGSQESQAAALAAAATAAAQRHHSNYAFGVWAALLLLLAAAAAAASAHRSLRTRCCCPRYWLAAAACGRGCCCLLLKQFDARAKGGGAGRRCLAAAGLDACMGEAWHSEQQHSGAGLCCTAIQQQVQRIHQPAGANTHLASCMRSATGRRPAGCTAPAGRRTRRPPAGRL